MEPYSSQMVLPVMNDENINGVIYTQHQPLKQQFSGFK